MRITMNTFARVLAPLLWGFTNALPKYESERIKRNEFLNAMREIEIEKDREEHRRSLVDRLLEVAERVMPSEVVDEGRRLNGQYYFSYKDVNDWNADVNLADMAIKYTGCQNIKRWDDDMASSGETSPLKMDRFVTFRICPKDSCSAYNKYGCSYNYGEYMIPMEDYLALMAEYHFQQFSRYCKTCYHCMSLDYYKVQEEEKEEEQVTTDDAAVLNMTKNDAYKYGDDYWAGYNRYWGEPDNDGGNRRRAGYSYSKQGGGAASYYYGDKGYNFSYGDDNLDVDRYWYEDEETGKCIFENVCSNFRSACKAFNPNATFYENYFTCTKYKVGNVKLYLAPLCRADGHSLGIGIYSDSYCSEYIGDEVDISSFTGQIFDDKELGNYYEKTCLSCSAVDGYSLVTDDAINPDEDLTYPLCSVLYKSSAKCNLHSDNVNFNGDEVNQEANENQVCTFLEALHDNSYNEHGTVVLRSGANHGLTGLRNRAVNSIQQVGLILSAMCFIFLAIYASYLTKKLYYRKAWRPPKSVHAPFSSGASVSATAKAVALAGQMSRASSGILATRSGRSMGDSPNSYLRDPWQADEDYRTPYNSRGHLA